MIRCHSDLTQLSALGEMIQKRTPFDYKIEAVFMRKYSADLSIISSDPHSSPVREEGQGDYPHLGDEQIAAVTIKATSSVWWSWSWNQGLASPDRWAFYHTQGAA